MNTIRTETYRQGGADVQEIILADGSKNYIVRKLVSGAILTIKTFFPRKNAYGLVYREMSLDSPLARKIAATLAA